QVALNASHTELTYTVHHSVSAAVSAGLFRGSMGQAGALVRSIVAAPETSGTLQVGPAEVADLLTGNYYVSVASTAFLSGEVRAQLLGLGAAAKTEGQASLSASLGEQAPAGPPQTAEHGSMQLILDEKTGALSYTIQL